jgi:DNA-binding transcriptional LysR family regulator
MDTFSNIKTFLVVARLQSFTRTADHLGIAASIVSKRVRQLEEFLGRPLLSRTTHSVGLTEFGESLLPDLRHLETLLEDALQKSRDSGLGKLAGPLKVKIAISLAMMGFDRLLGRFHRRYPEIDLRVVVADRRVDPLEEGIDVSLHGGSFEFEGVIDEPLFSYARILVASRSYIEKHGMPLHPGDLAHHFLLVLDRDDGWLRFQGEGEPALIKPHSNFSANSLAALVGAALEGCGMLVLPPKLLETGDRDNELVHLLPEYSLSDRWISAHLPVNRKDNPRVRAFVEFVRDEGLQIIKPEGYSRFANTERAM